MYEFDNIRMVDTMLQLKKNNKYLITDRLIKSLISLFTCGGSI